MKKYILFFILLALLSCGSSKTNVQESHPFQTEAGVVINGVRWATRNIADFRQFAIEADTTIFYTWGGRQVQVVNRSTGIFHHPMHAGHLFRDRENMGSSVFVATFNTEAMTWDEPRGSFVAPRAVWTRRDDPCPVGWRVPTVEEWHSLLSAPNTRITINGVNGRMFGRPPNSIFLPAEGYLNLPDNNFIGVGEIGRYWSRTSRGIANLPRFYFLQFSENTVNIRTTGGQSIAMSVRCVATR